MKNVVLGISAVMLTLAAPVQQALAQNVTVYEPASQWAVDAGEDYCRLMRDFSDGDNTVALLMERAHPNANVRVVLVGNSVRLFRGAENVGFRFLPGGSERMGQKLVSELPDGQQYLNLGQTQIAEFEMPAPGAPMGPPIYSRANEVEKAGAVNGIRLDAGLTRPIQLNTGSLGRPLEALQFCADDLLSYWGLDAEAHKTLSRPVMPGDGTPLPPGPGGFPANPSAGWIAQSVVPFADFARLSGGHNQVRVMVDAEGKATSCHIAEPRLSESTNRTICEQVMRNAKFQPALDADGNPIASYWMAGVFQLTPPFGGR